MGERKQHADFFTSPEIHPAFGALLALYIEHLWELLGRPCPFYIIEIGAGNGLLSNDILDYVSDMSSGFIDAMEYVVLDRFSPELFIGKAARLNTDVIPLSGITGCFISNELLDAFPVHRFQIEDSQLAEVYVTIEDGEFVERLGTPSTAELSKRLGDKILEMPDGYSGEICLVIDDWMVELDRALDYGFVITIDYGYNRDELYDPDRHFGTLETYFRHTRGSSPYQRVGRQDITAHVDFTAVMEAGVANGLRQVFFDDQARFLRGMGIEIWLDDLRTRELSYDERRSNIHGLTELINPEGLGRFKILVQEKNTRISDCKFVLPNKISSNSLDIPLLSPNHIGYLRKDRWLGYMEVEELWPLD